MNDVSTPQKPPNRWAKYINTRVEMIQKLTGEERTVILPRWIKYFDGYEEITALLESTKQLEEIKDNLQKLENDIDFYVIWMTQYIKAVSKLYGMYWKLHSAVSTVQHLESEKKLRDLQSSAPDIFPEYSEKATIKNILTEPVSSTAFNFLAKLVDKNGRLSLKLLRQEFWRYKRLKFIRWSGRFILRVFWSLLVFTLLIGGIINLFPLIWGVILSIMFWVLIEYVAQPKLQKKLDSKYRADLIDHVSNLYMARWEAQVTLEETNHYLNQAKKQLNELVQNEL